MGWVCTVRMKRRLGKGDARLFVHASQLNTREQFSRVVKIMSIPGTASLLFHSNISVTDDVHEVM